MNPHNNNTIYRGVEGPAGSTGSSGSQGGWNNTYHPASTVTATYYTASTL